MKERNKKTRKNIKESLKLTTLGFTLVELLAVIAVLGLILIIAVPKVQDTMDNSKKKTLELTVKSIARSAEEAYLEYDSFGTTDEITCESVADLSSDDYESCEISFDDDGKASVTLVGSGYYDGLYVCNGTKINAISTKTRCSTNSSCFTYENYLFPESFDINETECKAYFDTWSFSEEEINSICTGGVDNDGDSLNEIIHDEIPVSDFINSNVISNVILKEGLSITGYNTTCGLNVTIPSSINNTSVIAIKENAFTNKNIETVIIPSSVLKIGYLAFENFPNSLLKVELENQSAIIGNCAFGYIDDIITHNIPSTYQCKIL